jgi:hypothetical protein
VKRRAFVVAAGVLLAAPAAAAKALARRRPQVRGMLPAGRAQPARMPLSPQRVVLPRPDAETHPRAYHRNGHVGLRYELPIVVQGGAWPFVFELLEAPAGASIGAVHGDAYYGIVRWTPTQAGGFAFRVRVRDQDGDSVEVAWTGSVGSAWIAFIDAVDGSDQVGDGSLAAPWRTLAHANASVSGGRCLCLRAGSYAAPANSMSMATGLFASLIGWPDEQPVIDCGSQVDGVFAWLNGGDLYVANLTLTGGPPAAANPRYFSSLNPNSRCYQNRLTFDSPTAGTTSGGGDDNNSCLFLGAGGSQRRYVAQVHCTFRNLRRTNNGFSAIDTYQTRYLVVADNVFDTPFPGTGSRMALWIKGGDHEDVSVRGNRWAQAWNGDSLINVSMGRDGSGSDFSARRIEVCYNTVVSASGTGWSSIAMQFGMAAQPGDRGPVWVYRNTVRGIVVIDKRDWPLQISFENDIIVNDASVFGGTTSGKVMMIDPNDPADRFRDPALRPNISLVVAGSQCHGSSADGILDAQHRLQGPWRDAFLGSHGAEIAAGDALFADGFEADG